MNRTRRFTAVIAVAEVVLIGAVSLSPAQVLSAPIVPVQRIQTRRVDPLGGAKLPPMAPGAGPSYSGAAARGRGAGSDYYSDPASSQPSGIRSGASPYIAPGTGRQPIRARGGFTEFSEGGNRRGAQRQWSGGAMSDTKGMYR